jgi:hypothetical protein
VVEAGDIHAGEHNARWCFASGPNKNLAVWSDVNSQFIPEAHMLQTDRWRAQSSRQSIQELPVGDDPLPPDHVKMRVMVGILVVAHSKVVGAEATRAES